LGLRLINDLPLGVVSNEQGVVHALPSVEPTYLVCLEQK
jgi:hypothetical protein